MKWLIELKQVKNHNNWRFEGTVKAVDETTVVITVNGHGTEMTFEKPAIKQVDPS